MIELDILLKTKIYYIYIENVGVCPNFLIIIEIFLLEEGNTKFSFGEPFFF